MTRVLPRRAVERRSGERRKRVFSSGRGRVWLLNAGMLAYAALLYTTVVRNIDRLHTGSSALPLIALTGLFAVTEVFVVHLRFRHDAHTFSLSEIPLMLGLFYADPTTLLVAQLVGGGLVLLLYRRQPPVKLTFNLAIYAVSVTCAVITFRAALGDGDTFGLRGWFAGFGAALMVSFVSIPAIYLAVSLSDGRPGAKEFLRPVGFSVFAALVATSIGLLAVEVSASHPLGEVLLIVPALGVYLAYRAYVGEREKHEALQFLYDSTRLLHQSPELDAAVNAMLAKARDALRADLAVLAYASSDSGIILNRVGPDASGEHLGQLPDTSAADLQALFPGASRTLRVGTEVDSALLRRMVGDAELRDGLVVGLTGESGILGVLMVANRLSEVSGFQPAEARLLETLATHLSVALQNGRLEQSVEQLRLLERQLTHQATHDPLTGLANRNLFAERLTEALTEPENGLAVLFIDIDDFKTVNDSLGHAAGDALLTTIADRITTYTRGADAAARLGGDEFAVVLEDVRKPAAAIAVAERLLETLALPAQVSDQFLSMHASVGIALYSPELDGSVDAAVLMRNADTAMYAAKSRGKDRWVVFTSDMHEAARQRQSLTRDFATALRRGQFAVWFQPIVDLASDRVVAAEALLRWHHPTKGLLEPAEFLALAEETGHIKRLTEDTLRQACERAASWPRNPDGTVPAVSVNLPGRDFDDLDLTFLIPALLRDTGLPPERLVLEITETLMLTETPRGLDTLHELAATGVRLALDDFGTGYSSLSYLSQLPLRWIKLAKTLIDDIGNDDTHDALARGIIELGHVLRLGIIAEGIESHRQLDTLRRFGCDLGQGYVFSRPIPPEQFPRWLATHGGASLAARA